MVSIIIPAYNRFNLLLEALASVRRQTYAGPKEIILVDDGSTDKTGSFVNALDLVYLRCEHTGMPGKARNLGASAAEGDLLAFLDSDDLFNPEKLDIQVRFMAEHPSIGLSHTRETWLRNGRIVSQAGQRHKREGWIFHESLKKCVIGPSTVMMRRTLFVETGGFREDLEIAEDYEYWLRITAEHDVGYIDLPLTVKRAGHENQLSEKYGQIELFRIQALLPLVKGGAFTGENHTAARDELARKIGVYARGCEKRGRTEEAAYWLKELDTLPR